MAELTALVNECQLDPRFNDNAIEIALTIISETTCGNLFPGSAWKHPPGRSAS